MAAKLAARAVLQGVKPHLLSTDTGRAGAVAQLSDLGDIMGCRVTSATTAEDLRTSITAIFHDLGEAPPVLIDTPAVNPYAKADMDALQDLVAASEADPVLVLAAGADYAETSEQTQIFGNLGVERVILTRLDACRRIGGLLSALDAHRLSIANLSLSPYVGRGFLPATADELASAILSVPKSIISPKSEPQTKEPKKALS